MTGTWPCRHGGRMKGRLCWLRRHTGRRVQGSEGSGRCLEGVCLGIEAEGVMK